MNLDHYGPIPHSGTLGNGPVAAGAEPELLTVGGELALLRGVLESVGIRAAQLVERIEPVMDRGTDHAGVSRSLPPPTSRVGAEIRELVDRATAIADLLAAAGEQVRL